MARSRNYAAEYARRLELARARGHRGYYEERLSRARTARPGISTGGARGHATAGEREVERLVRAIKKLPADATIAFTGIDRRPNGTWSRGRFDLIGGADPDEHYIIPEDTLHMLPYVADQIAATGILVLGAKYLAAMTDFEEEQPAFAIKGRTGRYVVAIDRRGRARTTAKLEDAAIFQSDTGATRYLRRYRLHTRGYRMFVL